MTRCISAASAVISADWLAEIWAACALTWDT
jgi:hypothetical protein